MSSKIVIQRAGRLSAAALLAGLMLSAVFILAHWQAVRAANYGTVLISEIMYDPAVGHATPYGGADQQEEWVELYNPGDTAVDITNWKLTDEENYPTITSACTGPDDCDGVCTITNTTTIPAHGFILVAADPVYVSGILSSTTVVGCEITGSYELARTSNEVLALLDDSDRIVAGSLDVPFPALGATNQGEAVGLRYPAYGWSEDNADWTVENTVASSGVYRAHTAGAANTGWTWVTTPHTLTASINGTVVSPTEWSPNGEYLGKVDDVQFFLTWDANNLYLGFSGQNALTGTYIVALDTDPLNSGAANSGTTAALCGSAAFSGNHKPDYALQAGPNGLTTTQASGGAWSAWTVSNSTGVTNTSASGQAEFRVAFSDLGLTYGQPVGAYLFVCDAAAGAVRAAWPPENVTAGSSNMVNTGLDVALVLNAPDGAQSPRYEASHMGVFTVTTGNTPNEYHLWDNYMWLYVITPTTAAGGCDVVVQVMGNRIPTTQGAPSRRAYEFNADACPGMAVNLNFAYEDGTASRHLDGTPVRSKAQSAPNELLFMSENRLTLSRWDGSSWQLMPSASDSQCTWAGGTWHCPEGYYNYDWNTSINLLTIYNVSTFSKWTFSDEQDDYDPTAITLTDLRARPEAVPPLGLAGAGLLFGGALLLGHRIRRKGGLLR